MRGTSGELLAIILGIILGWVMAHSGVVAECKKLNSFYIGNTTFTCTVKESNRDH